MPNKRVLVIDEESAFTRFLQDDLEQREISVACVYSPGDENGAMAFAPNAVVADKNILTNEAAGLMQTFDKIERKLPLVLMTGTDTQLTHGSAAPVQASDAQIVATIPKPFEPNVLAELIDQYVQVSEKEILDSEYIAALVASDRLLDNLVVEFQSKHALTDGRVVGYEALSRLKTRRAISPATIFSAATEISLEIEATLNVFDQVMKLADSLHMRGKSVPVSFNCSAILLTRCEFVDAICTRLQRHRNLRESIIMEITEENRVANIKVVAEICHMLSRYGLAVSIDDYGTGHSNLDRIAEIPFAELKLDKEIFWAFCNGRVPITILGSIIDFCHMRGAKSVIEGVETPFHLEKARLLGADEGQGFYWGQAVPPQYLVKDWHGLLSHVLRKFASQHCAFLYGRPRCPHKWAAMQFGGSGDVATGIDRCRHRRPLLRQIADYPIRLLDRFELGCVYERQLEGIAMKQLSALDAMFAYTETPNTPMHIGQLLIYDPSTAPGGMVGFKDILRYIEGRLDGARIFRQKLVRVPLDLDHPYWVDDANFDLEFHVRHIALPKPGDWRQLCIQAARIYARPMDMNKPLWEYTVIEGLDNVEGVPKGSFAMLHKMHHAAIDGQSGLQMTLALHDLDAKMKPRTFDMQFEPEKDPNPIGLLAKAQFNNIANPVRGLQNLGKLLPMPKRLLDVQREFRQRDDAKGSIPKTRFNKKLSPHRVFDGREFALSDIKKIREAFPGATVNDVMIAVVSGSMRKYLKAKNDLPDKTLKIGAPVSVRTDDDKDTAGNQVTMMQVGVGTHLADAGERLKFIMQETQRSKAMTQAMGAKTLMELSGAMPAGLTAAGTKMMVRAGLVERLNPAVNTVVTNVPGPMVPMYFAGAELVKSFGMGILAEGQGLFHVVTSYNGNVILTFLADRNIMPDPEFYATCILNSFSDLMAAATKEKTTAARKTKAKKAKQPKKPKKRVAASAATAGRTRVKTTGK